MKTQMKISGVLLILNNHEKNIFGNKLPKSVLVGLFQLR
jgi:hypothetical protein